MKTTLKYYALLALLFGAALFAVFGCDYETPSSIQTAPATGDVHLASFVDISTAPSTSDPSGPVLACILNDVSGSMSYYGARPMVVADILPLIDAIKTIGGELAVGSIEARPSEPFLRLRLPPPEPEEPPTAKNVFTRNKLLREWRQAEPERKARKAQRQEQNRLHIENFLSRLQHFLKRPANATGTDIWSSLRRCEVFLEESDLYWTRVSESPPERFALLISDGRQTEHSMPSTLNPAIHVLVVSGNRGIGDFDQLSPPPLWFESPAAATLHITSTVRR